MCLSKKEREFIEDWLKVVDGSISEFAFYEKWAVKKDARNLLEVMEKKNRGDLDWKCCIRVMRHRIKKKYERMVEELKTLEKFLMQEKMP